MKRQDYQNYIWYPVTDETYWVEEYPNEFPGCQTIIRDKNCTFGGLPHIMTQNKSYLGWGTMAKSDYFEFMIIDNSIK